MTILLFTPASVKRRVASMPSTPGIRMSIRTTSGSSVRTASIAADPSPASPTTSRSGWASRIIRNPARISAWSSTMRTRIEPPPCPPPRAGEGLLPAIALNWGGSEGQAGVERESARGIASRFKLPAEKRDPLPHANQPVSRRGGGVAAVAGAVIANVEGEHRLRVVHPDVDAPGARVFEDVGRGFLHDPVGGQVDGGWTRTRFAIHAGVDLESGGAQSLDQAAQLADAGLRAAIGCGSVASTQGPEQPIQRDQGLACRGFDQAERLGRCLGLRRLNRTRRTCLDRDHADVVRDHVV